MSSMRNAVQRRNHKERAQPLERQKWGILEKHKDYSLRAKDYNEKQKRLKTLRQKAADRNPDEFHFAMMSSDNQRGIRRPQDQQEKRLDHETAKLLKTQDAAYLRTVLQSTRKARKSLEEELILKKAAKPTQDVQFNQEDSADPKNHVSFVEPAAELREQQRLSKTEIRQLAQRGGLSSSLAAAATTPARKRNEAHGIDEGVNAMEELSDDGDAEAESLESSSLSKEELTARQKRRREITGLENRLEAMRKRETALAIAEQELEVQRGKMQNSVGSVNKNGVKFRIRERKR